MQTPRESHHHYEGCAMAWVTYGFMNCIFGLLFLQAHCLSLVCANIYLSIWVINITMVCYMLIEHSEP